MNKKAIVLLSGGLDSILATRLMQEQGVEVVCFYFHIDFASCGSAAAAGKAAAALGAPLKTIDITGEYLAILSSPRHGYGANANPCIDCKIFMLKKAKERMTETGASFLVTGEVLGERPMSQRRDALDIISRDAGVRDMLLRPLSAKLLAPTMPEREGVVDREKLLAISGRSRKPQIELAAKFGITEYPNPAGGCLLTDPGFAARVKELIAREEMTVDNLKLLKYGRHFRLADGSKLVVGRDEKENEELAALARPGDIVLKLRDRQGPISVLRGASSQAAAGEAAAIAAYHTKYRAEPAVAVNYWKAASPSERKTVSVRPAQQTEVEALRL